MRLIRAVGRRGCALLFFAMLDAVYCFGLLSAPRPYPATYQWMDNILPLWVWASWWGLVGMICLVFAFRTYDTIAFVAAMSLKVAWALLSFFGWLAGVVDLGYISAAIWLAFAGFIFVIAGGIPAPTRKEPAQPWNPPSPD